MHTEILSPMAVSVSLSVGGVVNGHKSFMAATGLYGACLPPIQTSPVLWYCPGSNSLWKKQFHEKPKGLPTR